MIPRRGSPSRQACSEGSVSMRPRSRSSERLRLLAALAAAAAAASACRGASVVELPAEDSAASVLFVIERSGRAVHVVAQQRGKLFPLPVGAGDRVHALTYDRTLE